MPKSATQLRVDNYCTTHFNQQKNIQAFESFGLKTSADVIRFVSSPPGKEVSNYIERELQLMTAQQETTQFINHQENIQRQRLRALLFLSLLKSRAKIERLHQETQEQINKLLQKINQNSTIQDTPRQMLLDYKKALENYTELLETLTIELTAKEEELAQVEATIASIQQQQTIVNSAFKHAIASTQKIITAHTQQSAHLTAPQKKTFIQAQLAEEIKKDHGKTPDLWQNSKKAEQQIATLLNQQFLIDSYDLNEGKKHLFDAQGQKTTDYTQAHFIVPAEYKVVRDDRGNYYLIQTEQELANLSSTQKTSAFQSAKNQPSILTTPNLAERYQERLIGDLRRRETQAKLIKSTLQEEITALKARKHAVQETIIELKDDIQALEQESHDFFNEHGMSQDPTRHSASTPRPTPSQTASHTKMVTLLGNQHHIQRETNRHHSSHTKESTTTNFHTEEDLVKNEYPELSQYMLYLRERCSEILGENLSANHKPMGLA